MTKIEILKKNNLFLTAVYLSNLFLSFHLFLIIFINSSFLETFFSAASISILFAIGSFLNLLLLLESPKLMKKYGNYRMTLLFIVLELIAVIGLSISNNSIMAATSFLLHQAIIMMILFNLDIFLEDYSGKNENHTGGTRGMYLTIANITLLISPAIAGLVLTNGDFWRVYLVSALFLIPLFFTVKLGLKRPLKEIQDTGIRKSIRALRQNKDIFNIFLAQFILQFFFSWMTIYIPIHLYQNIGFEWTSIGLIFTIMLLPYLLFEFPLGQLADKKLGEKEILVTGFIFIALSTALIPFLKEASFILWAALLFATRIGGSFVEISSESYFFKHVNSENSNIISIFRVTKPLSFIVGPIVGAITFLTLNHFGLSYAYAFWVLALICLLGVKFGLAIKDTR